MLCGVRGSQAEWREISGNTNVAHFLSADEGAFRIERYDLDQHAWLAPLSLPATYGAPTTFHVTADGIYVAFGRAVKHYALDGSDELHVGSFASDVGQILQERGLVFINLISYNSPHLLSLDSTTFAILNTQSQGQFGIYPSFAGLSAAPGLRQLFGRSTGSSPGDIISLPYDAAGKLGAENESPYHGNFPDARSTWVFPGEQRVVDDSGTVYWTSNLTYSARLMGRGSIRQFTFLTNSESVALWQDPLDQRTQVVHYSADGLPLGSLEVTNSVRTLFASGTHVALFRPENSNHGIQAEVLEVADIHSPEPAPLPEPRALRYTPTAFAVDRDGMLLLTSPAHPALFRWNPVTQTYLGSVPLAEIPTHLAYSATAHAVYVAHSNGLVARVLLNAESPAEVPFATLASVPAGLAQTGDYLFTASYRGQQLFNPAAVSSALKIPVMDVQRPLWSAALEKIFYRTMSNPILVAERIYAFTSAPGQPLGSIGAEVIGSYSQTDPGIPLLVLADGKNLLTQSGRFTDPATLAPRATGLANPIDDALIDSSARIQSVRQLNPNLEVQAWDGLSYALKQSVTLPGTPLRLLKTFGSNTVVVAQTAGGDVVFHLLDQTLALVPPPELQPALRLDYVIEAHQQFRFTWAAVQGASGYLLQRRVAGATDWDFVTRTDAAATTATDPRVQVSKVYAYRIVATNGNLISMSAERLASSLPPTAPLNLTAQALSPFEIQLGWDPMDGVENYTVEFASDNAPQWQGIGTIQGNPPVFRYGNLQPGTAYRFRVKAANVFGDSPASEILKLTMPQAPPETPSLLSFYISTPYSVSVTWYAANYSTGGVIERRTLPDGEWTVRAQVSSSSFGISDDATLPSTRYEYRAYSTNELGRSAYSSVVLAETPPKPVPQMTYLYGVRPLGKQSLRIEWGVSQFQDGFRIERREEGNDTNWVRVATVEPDRQSFTDTHVQAGILYSYRVQAFNDVGDSDYSPVLSAQGEDVVPVFEETFNQTLAPFHWASISGAEMLSTDPTGHPWGALVFINNPAVAITVPLDLRNGGHLIYAFQDARTRTPLTYFGRVPPEFSTDGGHVWSQVSRAYPTDGESPGWGAMVVEILPQMQSSRTMFRWRVDVFQGVSGPFWALDNVRILAIRPKPPAVPAYLVSSPNSAHSVSLLWGDALGARRFDVERRVAGTEWQLLQSVPTSETFFTDDTAVPGAINAYRVRAVNPGGSSAAVGPTLVRTWTSLQQWNYEQFGDPDWLSAAQLDVPGSDGLTPRLRYAFNLDANTPGYTLSSGGTAGFPRVWLDRDSGGLAVEFLRRRSGTASGIEYEVQFSPDLIHWTPTGATAQIRTVDFLWESVRVQDPVAWTGAIARYCRVVVRAAP